MTDTPEASRSHHPSRARGVRILPFPLIDAKLPSATASPAVSRVRLRDAQLSLALPVRHEARQGSLKTQWVCEMEQGLFDVEHGSKRAQFPPFTQCGHSRLRASASSSSSNESCFVRPFTLVFDACPSCSMHKADPQLTMPGYPEAIEASSPCARSTVWRPRDISRWCWARVRAKQQSRPARGACLREQVVKKLAQIGCSICVIRPEQRSLHPRPQANVRKRKRITAFVASHRSGCGAALDRCRPLQKISPCRQGQSSAIHKISRPPSQGSYLRYEYQTQGPGTGSLICNPWRLTSTELLVRSKIAGPAALSVGRRAAANKAVPKAVDVLGTLDYKYLSYESLIPTHLKMVATS